MINQESARALFAIGFLTFSVLYLSAVSSHWKITPDSTKYVLAAKSLAAGEGYRVEGRTVQLRPPVPALVYAACFFAFPESYFYPNLVTTIFAIIAAYLSFLLLRNELGSVKGSALTLLVFGSVYLFKESTFLLSDVIYTVLSFGALILLQRHSGRHYGWVESLWVGAWVFVACMTRVIGVALPLAVLLLSFVTSLKDKKWKNSALNSIMLGTILSVILWDIRNALKGPSFFGLFLQNEPWVKEAGLVSPIGFVERFVGNIPEYGALGQILSNDALRHLGFSPVFLDITTALLSLLFVGGLLVSLARGFTINNLYTLIFVLIAGLYHPRIQVRWLIPVIPFIFCYTYVGLEFTTEKLRASFGACWAILCSALLTIYLLAYLAYAVYYIWGEIPNEHHSPFGQYPIKYVNNYDAQRMALWLRKNSSPEDALVALHPEIFNRITERRTYPLPLSSDSQKLLVKLKNKKEIRYVLADKRKRAVQTFLLPVLQEQADRFELLQDVEDAALYKVKRLE